MLDSPPEPPQQPAQTDGPASSIFTPLPDLGLPLSHSTSAPLPIPFTAAQRILSNNSDGSSGHRDSTRTPSPTGAPVTNGPEGPITPRNDAGPWVFDGSGVRLRADGTRDTGDGSLEAAVQAAGRVGDDDIS
jgi:hypothetical protein